MDLPAALGVEWISMKTLACLALLLALGTGTLLADAADPGTPAPAWQLQDLNGKTVQLSDFKGKVVILDFWTTWCPPCRAELPDFVALQKQYADKGVVIVGVSLDQGGPGVVSSFVKSHGIDYRIVIGNDNVATAYGNIQAIPTTFVIDRKGVIAAKHEGQTDKATFEQDIGKLL
jgi:peroxiredoxin